MIHFHGGPITPDTCALKAWKGRHAFISFANPGQLALASEVTQSFALDNGAFSFWDKGQPVNWYDYYEKETRAAVLVERIEAYNSASSLQYDADRDRFMPQMAFEI